MPNVQNWELSESHGFKETPTLLRRHPVDLGDMAPSSLR